MQKHVVFLIILFVYPIIGWGQSFQVHTYQATDGLPNELAKSVAKDSLGFLWAATDNGLIRFDGTSYKHLVDPLPSKYVKDVFKRSNGQLLASTDLGIVEVISHTDSISVKLLYKGSSQKSDTALWYPKSFYEDTQQRVWFSDNHALFKLDQKQDLARYPMPDRVIPNSYNRSFSFVEDGKGNFYAISETGIAFYFDESANTFQEVPLVANVTNVHAAISPQVGIIWIATDIGIIAVRSTDTGTLINPLIVLPDVDIACLVKIDQETIWGSSWWDKGLLSIPTDHPMKFQKVDQYPYSGASKIFKHHQQYWFATDNGLVMMQPHLFSNELAKYAPAYIQHIKATKEATYFTDGKKVFEIQENQYGFDSKVIHQSQKGTILRLCPTDEGIWLADTEGYLSLIDLQTNKLQKKLDLRQYGKTIFILELDQEGNLWICQDGLDGVAKINPDTEEVTIFQGPFKSKIILIKMAADGRLYFGGTEDQAYLYRYDPSNAQFENLSLPISFHHHIDISIEDIAIDGDTLWLASKFGLLRLHGDQINRIDLGELTEEAVKAVTIGKLGEIWLANSNGLLKYHQNHIWLFDEKNGLPSKIIAVRCLTADPQNKLWVGTAHGIGFIPQHQTPHQTLKPLLSSVESKGRRVYGISRRFTDQDYLKVKVISTEYPSEFLTYQYRVSGLQTDWVPVNSNQEIFLTNMHEGKYELHVRVRQQGNYSWSDELSYPFTIYRVWYNTWWGLLFIGIGIALILWLLIRLNTTRLKYEKRKLALMVEDRTKEVVEKQNAILAQNEELEQQRQELETTLEHLKATQTQLIQAEKMSSVGELTGGVAHEINNPLNFVMAGASTLPDLMDDLYRIIDQYIKIGEAKSEEEKIQLLAAAQEHRQKEHYEEIKQDLKDVISDMQDGAERTVYIVKTLQAFSQAERGTYQMANLNEGIDATLILLTNTLGDKIVITKEFEELPRIRCKAGMLNQVFMNILVNAHQAMDGIGQLLIKTEELENHLQITFKDSGRGIDEHTQKHIFEPFFTTSNSEKQVGLGLTIAKEIIEEHEGNIQVSSQLEKGTCFTIQLPKSNR